MRLSVNGRSLTGSLGPRRENTAPDVQKRPPRPSRDPSRPQSRLTDLFPAWEHQGGEHPQEATATQPLGGCLSLPSSTHPPMPSASWVPKAGREEGEAACLAGQARPSCAGQPNLALRNHSRPCQAPSTPVLGFFKATLGSSSPMPPSVQLGQGTSPRSRGELWRFMGPQAWGHAALCQLGSSRGPKALDGWIALEMPHLTTSYPASASCCCWSVYNQDHMGRELACPWRELTRSPDHPEATHRGTWPRTRHSPTPFHCETVLFRQL